MKMKKSEKGTKRCIGIIGHKHTKSCNKYVETDDDTYCDSHKYFIDLTNEEIEKIKDGEVKCCTRCNRWHFGNKKRCQPCIDYNSKLQKEKKQAIKKCGWFDRHDDPCRRNAFEDTDYCDVHQYVKDYTEEMKEQSELCLGCVKVKYLVNGCDVCKVRAAENRAKAKLEPQIICKGYVGDEPCTFKADENGYCGKHQLQLWKGDMEKDGTKKVCIGYERSCRNILDKNDKYSSCKECIYANSYSEYIHGAKRRGLPFELSHEYFYELINKPCYYCNDKNQIGWNGIDRKDNDIGYTYTNSVACCTMCNKMKFEHTENNFVKYCENICDNYPYHGFFENPEAIKHLSYERYKINAERRNLEFKISKNEFNETLLKKCFYCGNTNISNQIGIDRIINDQGYHLPNMVSCCKICNKMKKKYESNEFITKIKNIISIRKN